MDEDPFYSSPVEGEVVEQKNNYIFKEFKLELEDDTFTDGKLIFFYILAVFSKPKRGRRNRKNPVQQKQKAYLHQANTQVLLHHHRIQNNHPNHMMI